LPVAQSHYSSDRMVRGQITPSRAAGRHHYARGSSRPEILRVLRASVVK